MTSKYLYFIRYWKFSNPEYCGIYHGAVFDNYEKALTFCEAVRNQHKGSGVNYAIFSWMLPAEAEFDLIKNSVSEKSKKIVRYGILVNPLHEEGRMFLFNGIYDTKEEAELKAKTTREYAKNLNDAYKNDKKCRYDVVEIHQSLLAKPKYTWQVRKYWGEDVILSSNKDVFYDSDFEALSAAASELQKTKLEEGTGGIEIVILKDDVDHKTWVLE